MPQRAMGAGQWLLLLVTAASFASSVLFNKILVGQIPPITLAALRVLLALPLCLLVLRLAGRQLPAGWADRLVVFKAALGVIVVPYCALAIGQRTIAGGLSGILYSTMPLFTLLVAHLMLPDERLGLRKLVGVGLGMAGVIAVIGPSLLGGLGSDVSGELITLLGPLAYAIATVVMRRSSHLDPIGLTAGLFVAASGILVPLALLVDRPWSLRLDPGTMGWLVALATLGTILPAALNYLLLQRVGATRASIGMFVMPLFAVALGAIFLDERLGVGAFAGLALILAASRLVTYVPGASRPSGASDGRLAS